MNAAEKTMNQFYQGKLAERLMQMAHVEKNRQMLRRGALKMQDGTLGQPGDPDMDEDVNIHIGDVNQMQPEVRSEPVAEPSSASSLGKWVLVAAGLLGSGGLGAAVPWMAGAFESSTVVERQEMGMGVDVIPGGAVE